MTGNTRTVAFRISGDLFEKIISTPGYMSPSEWLRVAVREKLERDKVEARES
ncbi:MAG: hypothetical protein NTV61_11525 [Candidatus Bathyarchaeota archaeon]|nr:hypothetical protein [Candidatus Bathyarchaeota archaeon]